MIIKATRVCKSQFDCQIITFKQYFRIVKSNKRVILDSQLTQAKYIPLVDKLDHFSADRVTVNVGGETIKNLHVHTNAKTKLIQDICWTNRLK